MEIPVKFMVERLKKLPANAFVTEDGNKVYAAFKDELVIFTTDDGKFNRMAEHELRSFIRKNANKTGTPVEEEPQTDLVYQDGDWFMDSSEGSDKIWELQYDIDRNSHVWVDLVNPWERKPQGRQVQTPERSLWKPEEVTNDDDQGHGAP